jgi:hypothetical protein
LRILRAGLAVLALLLETSLLAAETARAADQESGEIDGGEVSPRFDPWDGVDKNGRIPKVDLPDDLDHPERWRYIPEGRIKPGNVFQRLLVSSFIIPFIFRDGDIGTGIGLGLTDIDFRLQRRREFLGAFFSYTTRGQQSYSLVWQRWLKTRDLPQGGVIQEERSFVGAGLGYEKTLTRRYFGQGPARQAFQESSYTDRVIAAAIGMSYSLPKPVSNLVLEVGIDMELHELSDGTVSGAPSTRFAYPAQFARAETWNFGRLNAELRWDTRDSQQNPYRGWDVGLRMAAPLIQTGWVPGAVFRVFGSKILPVPPLLHDGGDDQEAHPPTDVVAFGFFTESSVGELPFFLLPTLGGSRTLRGYIDGRWRGRASWTASVEYRFWVIARGMPITRTIRLERLGLAAFYEAGAVDGNWPTVFKARPAQSYGIGMRVSLERAALFRLDIGFSEDGYNFAAGFGVPF